MGANENSNVYTLSVSIASIDAIGKNLYSNAAAVLSELVANAWDADATEVNIDYDRQSERMVIEDNGCGMSKQALNDRYLTVGYRKRETEGGYSPVYGRPFMGRKGIGKLSVFSLANDVEVLSKTKDSEAEGFKINVSELEEVIQKGNGNVYHPHPIESKPTDFGEHGTRIVLTNLNKKRVDATMKALRRRIARRFDVLDLALPDTNQGPFKVIINGDPVTYEDRDDLKRVEYIWTLGGYELSGDAIKAKIINIKPEKTKTQFGTIRGWVGTVPKTTDLEFLDDEESLKNIIVLARRRPIQEGIIEQLPVSRLFSSYLTGQLIVDFLDQDDQPDIATSDRQRLMEDDERVIAFKRKITEIFKKLADEWSNLRTKDRNEKLLQNIPEVRAWIDSKGDHKKAAGKLIKAISRIEDENFSDSDRRKLCKSHIVAFERLERTGKISKLKDEKNISASTLLALLNDYSELETLQYGQIAHDRIAVIEKIEEHLENNTKENELRDYIADNPWVLDPGWDPVAKDTVREKTFKRIGKDQFKIDFDENSEENRRVDLLQLTALGKSLVLEFKRYGITPKLEDLLLQINRYASAMTRLYEQEDAQYGKQPGSTNNSLIDNRVEVVVIVKNVKYDGKILAVSQANEHVKHLNARFLYYTDILNQSRKKYEEFTKEHPGSRRIREALKALSQ